jgi:hypothetical protein
VTGIESKGPNQFDNDWYDFVMQLENSDGQSTSHYITIPTTAQKSFMFGSKKSLAEYAKLEKLLLGFGIKLEYSNAITQIATLFSDAAANFVGKQVSMRLGYNSNHLKFIGKNGEVSEYKILDKKGDEVTPLVFAGFEAGEQYAKENNIKLQAFIRVQEVVPSTVATISLAANDTSLPF